MKNYAANPWSGVFYRLNIVCHCAVKGNSSEEKDGIHYIQVKAVKSHFSCKSEWPMIFLDH
ncbi:MAG TPA: hypothetical protein PL027_10185, partial [Thermosynergistes sp.]|nr:hypothetical protein [Thermosynergistes sp.]